MTKNAQIEAKNRQVLFHEPQEVFTWFHLFASTPHASCYEKALSDKVKDWAQSAGLEVLQDDIANLLIRKPGQHGLEHSSPIILHGHSDMVAAIEPESMHDFEKDALELCLVGDDEIWAVGTSLGADNGIGVSMIMALLASKDLKHPPLEAVITVQNERGKVGAGNYPMQWLSAKRFLDINWFRETDILIGHGGDLTARLSLECTFEPIPATWQTFKLTVSGGTGGHCEMNIGDERANSIVVTGRILRGLEAKARICHAQAGHQNTAIPTSGQVTFAVPQGNHQFIEDRVNAIKRTILMEHSVSDAKLSIDLVHVNGCTSMSTQSDTSTFVNLLSALPNGVASRSLEHPDLIECSSNIGLLWTESEGLRLLITITSLVTTRKHAILDRLKALQQLSGDRVKLECIWSESPEVVPVEESRLLHTAQKVYEPVFGRQPVTKFASVSFEFGIFKKAIPDLDIICIGADMDQLHSSKEHFYIASVARVWRYLQAIMAELND